MTSAGFGCVGVRLYYVFFFSYTSYFSSFILSRHWNDVVIVSVLGSVNGLSSSASSRMAVILSNDDYRYNSSLDVLTSTRAFGAIIRHTPIHYKSHFVSEYMKHFNRHDFLYGNYLPNDQRAKTYSNMQSFISIIHKNSLLSSTDLKWLYIFEDDVAICSKADEVMAKLDDVERVSRERSIPVIYGGACCNVSLCSSTSATETNTTTLLCSGRCAHSFALYRENINDTLNDILNSYTKMSLELLYFDVRLNAYADRVGGIPTATSLSCGNDYCGLFYQDRIKFQSIIGRLK